MSLLSDVVEDRDAGRGFRVTTIRELIQLFVMLTRATALAVTGFVSLFEGCSFEGSGFKWAATA